MYLHHFKDKGSKGDINHGVLRGIKRKKQYSMLIDAAAVVIPLMKKKTDILNPGSLSELNCYASIWCSIENFWLAATAEGYGCNVELAWIVLEEEQVELGYWGKYANFEFRAVCDFKDGQWTIGEIYYQ